VTVHISRHHTEDSYPDLARAFGGKHHTTAISAVQKIIERVKDDASLVLPVRVPAWRGSCKVRPP